MITIRDFMYLCLEDSIQLIEIWDCNTEETLYKGSYDDMPTEYDGAEIDSWNGIQDCGICFNIGL